MGERGLDERGRLIRDEIMGAAVRGLDLCEWDVVGEVAARIINMIDLLARAPAAQTDTEGEREELRERIKANTGCADKMWGIIRYVAKGAPRWTEPFTKGAALALAEAIMATNRTKTSPREELSPIAAPWGDLSPEGVGDHKAWCSLHGFTYEVGSGEAIPDCTCARAHDSDRYHEESYHDLVHAIEEHLPDCIIEDDVAEIAIMVEAIERAGARLRSSTGHPPETLAAATKLAAQLREKAADASHLSESPPGASESERANAATGYVIFSHVMAEGADALDALVRGSSTGGRIVRMRVDRLNWPDLKSDCEVVGTISREDAPYRPVCGDIVLLHPTDGGVEA